MILVRFSSRALLYLCSIMPKKILTTAGISGALAVMLGAFGAHALKKILSPESLMAFETGVRYQFLHVFAMIAVALLYPSYPSRYLNWSYRFFAIGTVLFSGSLYLLTTMGWTILGPVTPLGGLSFILGWSTLVLAVIKQK